MLPTSELNRTAFLISKNSKLRSAPTLLSFL